MHKISGVEFNKGCPIGAERGETKRLVRQEEQQRRVNGIRQERVEGRARGQNMVESRAGEVMTRGKKQAEWHGLGMAMHDRAG